MIKAAIIMVPLCLIGALIGLIAYAANPDIPASQAAAYTFQTVLPAGLSGLAIAALLATIMSSADSYLNSAAISFVSDIIKPLQQKERSDTELLSISRLTTVGIGAVAIMISFKAKNILDILLHTYKFWGPIILIPLAALIMGKVISKKGFYACCLSGAGTVFLWEATSLETVMGIDSLIPGVLINFVCFFMQYCLQHRNRN